jgi:ADP-ribose pyrophosphatase YjhB (NUDIX family)
VKVALLKVADRARRVVWRIYGPRTIGVRGLVVDDRNRILLVRHSYGRPAWHLPGGGVKRRESLIQALNRELKEEAGVEIEGAPKLLGAYSNMREGKSDHITVFVVDQWRRDADAPQDKEIAAAEMFAPDQLPPDATPGTRRRIEEWQGSRQNDFDW